MRIAQVVLNSVKKSLLLNDFAYPHVLLVSTALMLIVAVPTFFSLMFIKAPYGRYHDKAGNWGPLIPAKLGWILMESPNLWVTAVLYMRNPVEIGYVNKILLGCFLLHYINRSLIFPFRMKSTSPMTLVVCLSALTFCSWNGFNQAVSLLYVNKHPLEWSESPQFKIGILLFFVGFLINVYADTVLMNLRKDSDRPGVYIIPKGFLFSYVTCPNYAGEILEWFGFALACNSFPAYVFLIYTIANLAPRAFNHHQWYLEKFEDYPKNRKALIPFLI